MRRLQLGTSLEGSSQITTTSPCHRHLLLPAKEHHPEEDEDNEEEENGEIAYELSNKLCKRCGQIYLVGPIQAIWCGKFYWSINTWKYTVLVQELNYSVEFNKQFQQHGFSKISCRCVSSRSAEWVQMQTDEDFHYSRTMIFHLPFNQVTATILQRRALPKKKGRRYFSIFVNQSRRTLSTVV